tara:strand:- start:493 stop:2313 length:1821 start_codon:yes stop_codon:yes gene_type:complete
MAILWCDPYIESPSGGVDGTTGTGTLGSYANPYSMDNLPENTGYTAGDEIRVKALPASPWLTGPTFSTNTSTLYGVHWSVAPAQHSFIKYTSIKGEKTYVNWNTPSRLNTISYATPWQSTSPYPDRTQLAYKLDPQYYLSNLVTVAKANLFYGQDNVATTLTAGWVSETARGGETIVQRVLPTVAAERWFGSATITNNKMVVDAPELTIAHSTTSTSRNMYIYGETVEVFDINERSGAGSSNSIRINTALTFKANSLVSGSYIYIYSPYYDTTATQGINRDVKHILGGYAFYSVNQGASTVTNHLKFKNFLFYYYYGNDGQVGVLNYYDDFYFKLVQPLQNTSPTEMAIDAAVSIATVFPYRDAISSIGPAYSHTSNNNYMLSHASSASVTGEYLAAGAKITATYGDVYFRDLVLPSGGTLENLTSTNIKQNTGSTLNYYQGKAWGVDRNSGRRVAFIAGNSITEDMTMMYNSTEYSNKMVYHFMPNVIQSRDRVYMDMPTGVTELDNSTYRLKITLGGTSVGSVLLKGYLEGNNSNATWTRATATIGTVTSATGGAGTVIYSSNFSDSAALTGVQQVSLILELQQNASTAAVAKICIESIELEVV